MRQLTEKQLSQLTNIKPFDFNFKPLHFLYCSNDKKVYAFTEEPNSQASNYVQFGSIEYINGWLYGAVQAKCNMFINAK